MAPRAPNRGDLTLFLAVAFGGSWGLTALAYLAGVKLGGVATIAIGVPYMFFPALGAWLAERRRGASIRTSLDLTFKPNAWWAVGWLAPVLLALLTLGLALTFPGVSLIDSLVGLLDKVAGQVPPAKLAEARAKLTALPVPLFVLLSVGQALTMGPTINALAAFGEELGWRGYLQRAVAPLGFWKGSALVGLLWGPWHAALIVQGYNYPQHPFIGVAMMTVMTVLLSPLVAAARLGGRSVIAAAICHGSFNAAAGFAVIFLRESNDLLVGVTGLAGALALAIFDVGLFLAMKRWPLPVAG